MTAATTLVYVGTYTDTPVRPRDAGTARGLVVYELDAAAGTLSLVHSHEGISNPSYLALDPQQRYLYCVAEVDAGQVHAFRIDPVTGSLTALNHQSSHGAGPAHLSVERSGHWVFVANYGSGSVAVFPILPDGRLGAATDTVQHTGHGGDAKLQEGPHAHWIGADPSNRFVLVVDLGLDAVLRYRFDATRGTLGQTEGPACRLTPGSGPRHLAFRPDGRYAYVIDELDSTLVACAYDPSSGTLRPLQRVSTLPAAVTGTNTTAAVRVAPSGRFVYGSNRGHDSIIVFTSDPTTGQLTYVEHVAIGGREPRDFAIDPTGACLLVAQQHSDQLATFQVDATSGRLRATGQAAAIAAPVCLACSRRHAPDARG